MKEREVGENLTRIIIAFMVLLGVMVIGEVIRDSQQVSFDLELKGATKGVLINGKSELKLPLNMTLDSISLSGKIHVSAPYAMWKEVRSEVEEND